MEFLPTPDIPRGKSYKGPRGVASPSRTLTHAEHETVLYGRRISAVDLTPRAQRPEAVTPLGYCSWGDLPPVARTFSRKAEKAGREVTHLRQSVRPVDHRGRRVSRVDTIVWVRVQVLNRRIVRAWRLRQGAGRWEPLVTALCRPWRGRAVLASIPPARADAIISGADDGGNLGVCLTCSDPKGHRCACGERGVHKVGGGTGRCHRCVSKAARKVEVGE